MEIRRQNGLTLYELLITMLVIGVILSIGVPNFAEFTQNSRLTSTSNDLLSSFQIARSEAARSKANITICASNNSLAPTANCGGTFNDGWIVFIDIDGDLNRAGAGENVIRAHPSVADGVNVVTNAGSTYFSFAGTGLGRGNVGITPALSAAMICDARGIAVAPGGRATARRVVATAIGRATVISDRQMILNAGGVCP
ncbi:MAG: prepilin-type N-terminal cleavage/methylation domain-containing protein [Woeseia sp.]|jgi:type IV fimbrial biogenesis protein FimT|nr:prepilin-type N-terminal cleavage/methylation domain-containing protein [Woeseia sp.]MBT6211902.1 prepilin-type N-terminal cleavage/methylation domain-containing protein [Woeseia sp.]